MEISAFFNSRIAIQWGSTIRSCPDFDWSKNGWFANGLDLEWDLEAQPFENQPKWQQSCFTILICTVSTYFEWSGF